MNDKLGKEAEEKIKHWLDRKDDGYAFYRLYDIMTGFYGQKNECDFICYKHPFMYFIESKATYNSRFEFSMITDFQFKSLLKRSNIFGCYGIIIVLFASHKRAFILDIQTIDNIQKSGKKSINIDKIETWDFPYSEILTVPNSRKKHLDYIGELESYLPIARWNSLGHTI